MKILLYPDTHHKRYKITKLKLFIELLGIELADGIEDDYDVLLYWSYHKGIRPLDDFLLRERTKRHIINAGGWNTMKTQNERVMKEAFGYNTLVDPFTYKGAMAEKSEKQGSHDLKILNSFKEKKDGYIYVKLIDNRISDDIVRDYRIYVYGNNMVLIAIEDKSMDNRFGMAEVSDVEICDNPKDVFSDDEIRKIEFFCEIYDTEFTELDVIRDSDERLYVVDNNNVPAYGLAMRAVFERNNGKTLNYLASKFYEMLEKHVI